MNRPRCAIKAHLVLLMAALALACIPGVAFADSAEASSSVFGARMVAEEGRRQELADAEPEAVAEDEALTAVEDVEADGTPEQWVRIAGSNARQTMRKIVQHDNVFNADNTDNVMVATEANYKDALSAAGYAGMANAPILITNGKKLSEETRAEIKRLAPEWIGIVGGPKVITDGVMNELKQLCPNVERAYGQNAVQTSVMIYKSGNADDWDYYAIVATSDSYKDALSVAPFAYWAWSPIFLANTNKDPNKRILSNEVLDCLQNGHFEKVIIVGGPKAVSSKVEGQLAQRGLAYQRVYGSNAIDTSRKVAEFALREEMGLAYMGVATTSGFKDALCAVPLCGQRSSILTLCNPTGGLDAFNAVYDSRQVQKGCVFGGEKAISAANYRAITTAP